LFLASCHFCWGEQLLPQLKSSVSLWNSHLRFICFMPKEKGWGRNGRVSILLWLWLLWNVGETLQDERVHGGTFVSTDSLQMPFKQIPVGLPLIFWATSFSCAGAGSCRNFTCGYQTNNLTNFLHWQNAGMRLYGGAQYHRAMAEFRFLVGGVKCPILSREEIVNACGVEDIHDGTNYYRYYGCSHML
jgi:hypothetical protein